MMGKTQEIFGSGQKSNKKLSTVNVRFNEPKIKIENSNDDDSDIAGRP